MSARQVIVGGRSLKAKVNGVDSKVREKSTLDSLPCVARESHADSSASGMDSLEECMRRK